MTNFDPSLEGPPEPVVVTQADEQAAKAAAMDVYCANSDVLCGADVEEMEKALALAFARHRLSHTLPDERSLHEAIATYLRERGLWRLDFVLRGDGGYEATTRTKEGCESPDERLRVAVEALRMAERAMHAMLLGISVHNDLHADAPARRENIKGEVVDGLAAAEQRARQALASQQEKAP